MLKKILCRTKIDKELLGKLKVIYEEDEITIFNYLELININAQLIDTLKVLVKGESLKVIYQDPVKIKITGKVVEVCKK